MKSLVRLLGLVFLLLMLLLTATLFAQIWLQRETQRLRLETEQETRRKLDVLFELQSFSEYSRGKGDLERLGLLLGGKVAPSEAPLPPQSSVVAFDYVVPGTAGRAPQPTRLRVEIPLSAINRLFLFHERGIVALLVAGLALLGSIVAVGIVWFLRRDALPGSRPPFAPASGRDVKSLVHFAQTSAEKEQELAQMLERNERANQDLRLNQQLLSRALEDKAELGRNLHDGVVQSLYAAGLTLEAAKAELAASPDEANLRIGRTLDLLNMTIRDVRGYINGLSPESLARSGFRQALGALADELRADRPVDFDFRIDDAATVELTPEQAKELLQIARETISNSLRHGSATAVAVYLGLHPESIELLIRDNGCGFDPKRRKAEGHGLRNIEARASRLKGRWELSSKQGKGTVVRLSLPKAASKA